MLSKSKQADRGVQMALIENELAHMNQEILDHTKQDMVNFSKIDARFETINDKVDDVIVQVNRNHLQVITKLTQIVGIAVGALAVLNIALSILT